MDEPEEHFFQLLDELFRRPEDFQHILQPAGDGDLSQRLYRYSRQRGFEFEFDQFNELLKRSAEQVRQIAAKKESGLAQKKTAE